MEWSVKARVAGWSSAWLDAPQVPRSSDIGAQPAEGDAAEEQHARGFRIQRPELKGASIQAGQPPDGFAQDCKGDQGDQPGDDGPAQPVPKAIVEKRPTHEGIAAADQLRDLDFVP